MAYQPMFEAPIAAETNGRSPEYANPEFEQEWETSAAYSNPEMESEWETYETSQYSNPYAHPEYESEWEMQESDPYTNPEYESEWEMQESNPYAHPELTPEWEMQESDPYASPEYEDEGEYFFKKMFKRIGGGLKKLVKVAVPFAKRLAPMVAGGLASMIPGAGVVAGPLAAKLTGQLVREGEMEAAQFESEVFGSNEAEAEVANTEIAHEAALTEFLASQAAEATTEAEAEAAIGSALPITITIMGGRRALRPVMPVLAQANSQIVKTLRQQGPVGKQLVRTVPAMQRRAVATMKAAARSGQPINSAMAVKAMASASRRVLSNPQTVQKAMVRNAVLRQRTAPPNPRRAAASRCPTCAAKR